MPLADTPDALKVRRLISDEPTSASLIASIPEQDLRVRVQLDVFTHTRSPMFFLHMQTEGEGEGILEYSMRVCFAKPWGPDFDCLATLVGFVQTREFSSRAVAPFVEHLRMLRGTN